MTARQESFLRVSVMKSCRESPPPDLQLDIDMHMKETADLILQKEQGIAEMVWSLW